ncbi:heavy metal-responsive transcriptional regulator [Paucibacter sp. Y2R2-4]|uniref:heavy metal-responsive transcriptional regulator n=1 Tax=Paucibacter sp. Y2R2-4 TaxID=2893553 RepID=UPI0021E3D907|nr:heavy metal-responsive transcriptional regulator [Paucibacter sp. Y2R2-4]MCV2351213.1 heavy metal-responsive transcriptional regulator [Paucibacter sp. Y2R2-4]
MNISQLARACQTSTDTVRYYEKQGLLAAPARQENGYRSYAPAQVEQLRFIRGAQALGFSLQEIREILPLLAQGQLGRAEIEQQLQAKMAQIDAHIAQLQHLKTELAATFASLRCAPESRLKTADAVAPDSGSGTGVAVLKRSFAPPKRRSTKG